jgi:uncharacterized membrane protein
MNLIPKLVAIFVLIIVDLIWVTLNKPMYKSLVFGVTNRAMDINLPSAIVAYSLMIVGFVAIVLPQIIVKPGSSILDFAMTALRYGGLFGLVVYGIFNATNYAIFKNYSLKVSLIDTLWGITGYTFASFVYIIICQYY